MEFVSWIFFGPAKLIALWPHAGVVIAAGLITLQAWLTWRAGTAFGRGFFREAAVFTGLLWLIFNAFELQMSAFAGRTAGTSLRLELIVLVPILYVLTAAAVLSLARQMKQPEQPVTTDHKDSGE